MRLTNRTASRRTRASVIVVCAALFIPAIATPGVASTTQEVRGTILFPSTDPETARAAYLESDGAANGVHGFVFTVDPESIGQSFSLQSTAEEPALIYFYSDFAKGVACGEPIWPQPEQGVVCGTQALIVQTGSTANVAVSYVSKPTLSEHLAYVGTQRYAGSDLVIHRAPDRRNLLTSGVVGRGFDTWDIADPARPRLLIEYRPALPLPGDPYLDVGTTRGRTIVALTNQPSLDKAPPGVYPNPDPSERTEFVDVTLDSANHARLLGTLYRSAHSGALVGDRQLYLPATYGADGSEAGLEIYDISPLLTAQSASPTVLFPDTPPLGNPVKLWEQSSYRGSRPVGPPFTRTRSVNVYTNHAGSGRDIALLTEEGSGDGDGSVFFVDITDPRHPEVLNRWAAPESGIAKYHEAQFVDGDSRVIVLAGDSSPDSVKADFWIAHCNSGGSGDACDRVCDADARTCIENLDWAEPDVVGRWAVPDSSGAPCAAHRFNTEGARLYVGACQAGTWLVDLSDPKHPATLARWTPEPTNTNAVSSYKGFIFSSDRVRGLDTLRYCPRCLPGKQ